jgi:DNA-binding NtrC family response regulator
MPGVPLLRLLIIDDDELLRTALEGALADLFGWTVVSAKDHVAAREHYATVDVVRSDWNMPAGGGAVVLRESPKPVLIYSSEIASLEHRFRLRKPARIEAIRDAVTQAWSSGRG